MLQQLGKYEILEKLGNGGFGTVFKARDTVLDRPVAVKILHPYLVGQTGFIKRFYREARSAAKLEHPHIVPIYEVGEAEGRHFIVMRYLEGEPLNSLLAEAGDPLSIRESLGILEDVASALDYAHSKGIVHRDVKPSNIFVTSNGAVLGDFGIVRVLDDASRVTATGQALGTPEYMAPEQIKGEDVDARTDIYALGVVAYEMLTGQVPFTGTTPFAIQEGHVHRAFTPPQTLNPQLPAAVNSVFEQVLAKSQEHRYAQTWDFVQSLREASAGFASSSESREARGKLKSAFKQNSSTSSAQSGAQRGSSAQSVAETLNSEEVQRGNHPFQETEQESETSGSKAPYRKALLLGVIGVVLGALGACIGIFLPLFASIASFIGLVLGIWGLIKARQRSGARAVMIWSIVAIVINAILLLTSCVMESFSLLSSS
jgi:serine/threonine protein kinase